MISQIIVSDYYEALLTIVDASTRRSIAAAMSSCDQNTPAIYEAATCEQCDPCLDAGDVWTICDPCSDVIVGCFRRHVIALRLFHYIIHLAPG